MMTSSSRLPDQAMQKSARQLLMDLHAFSGQVCGLGSRGLLLKKAWRQQGHQRCLVLQVCVTPRGHHHMPLAACVMEKSSRTLGVRCLQWRPGHTPLKLHLYTFHAISSAAHTRHTISCQPRLAVTPGWSSSIPLGCIARRRPLAPLTLSDSNNGLEQIGETAEDTKVGR